MNLANPLFHLNGIEQRYFRRQKTGKTGSLFQKSKSVDKYYDIA